MSVYKDAERKTWTVKFQYKDWTGKRKWITKRGFSTKREASEWEADFKMKKAGNLEMPLRDFIEVYVEDMRERLKESTMETKINIIQNRILPYLGNRPVQDITSTDVMQWQNALMKERDRFGKPFSSAYLKTVHNQLSAIFNHAMKFYKLSENPARTVGNMGSEKDIKMRFWTKEEYLRFSEAIMDKPLAYYCFEVLYWAGIREGELLALTPEDIDLDKRTLTVSKTYHRTNKTDVVTSPKTPSSNRTVYLPDFLCNELKEYMEMYYELHTTDRLFPVTKHFLYHNMISGSKEAGVKRIRVHDLRHSHVSLLIDMGYSAVAIAERMGHQSIHITYRYAHLFPTVQKNMANKLDAAREEEEDV